MKKILFENGKTIDGASTFNTMQDNVEDVFNGKESMGSIVVEDITCKNYINNYLCRLGTYSGLTISVVDGKLILNGTTTDIVDIYCISDTFNPKILNIANTKLGTYTLSNNLGLQNYIRIGSAYQNDTVEITEENQLQWAFIRVPSGKTYNNTELKIQFEKGLVATNYVEPKEFSNKQIYSTNEQVIGIWIDGKPLYRKVIDFGSLPNATYKEVSHSIRNLDTIVNAYGVSIRSDKTSIPLPYASSNYVELYINATKVTIATTSDRSLFNGYVTLEYTKTTD